MKLLLALAAGYVLGARNGGEHVDDVVRSLRAVKDSEEFHDLVNSLRAHASATLRDLASIVDQPGGSADGDLGDATDLVERVRSLTGLR